MLHLTSANHFVVFPVLLKPFWLNDAAETDEGCKTLIKVRMGGWFVSEGANITIPINGNTGFHRCPVISTRYASITFPVLPPPTPVALQTFLPCPYRYKALNTLVWAVCHLARKCFNSMVMTNYKTLVNEP